MKIKNEIMKHDMRPIASLLLVLLALTARAQVQNMIVYKADGTAIRIDVEGIDSVAFEQISKWGNRSPEAQNLLSYLEENVGQKILTGTHACVNYNTNEADWVYKHTGKTNWSPKHNAVFAISPTDATTTKTGESAPWRADIYWMSPDPLDVLWPFEEDWYEISWPTSAPVFIVSDIIENTGLPIIAPTMPPE